MLCIKSDGLQKNTRAIKSAMRLQAMWKMHRTNANNSTMLGKHSSKLQEKSSE